MAKASAARTKKAPEPKEICDVTTDASQLRVAVEYLDNLRRQIMRNQKQVKIVQTRDGKVIDVAIHINGKTAGAPEPAAPTGEGGQGNQGS